MQPQQKIEITRNAKVRKVEIIAMESSVENTL